MTYVETIVSKTPNVVGRWDGGQARVLELITCYAVRCCVPGHEYGQNLVIAVCLPIVLAGQRIGLTQKSGCVSFRWFPALKAVH